MAEFKFSFSKPKPKTKTNNTPIRKCIQKDVFGVIGIKLDSTYFVDINGKEYPLTIESYNVKGKKEYYAICLQNDKLLHIIRYNNRPCNSKVYLPFYVGAIVKGSTYLIFGAERFNFKKVYHKSELTENEYGKYKFKSEHYKKFFKEHYKEIMECMM